MASNIFQGHYNKQVEKYLPPLRIFGGFLYKSQSVFLLKNILTRKK